MAQTENIRIGALVAGLRSPRPLPPPDLSGAPVLDEWRWHEPPAEPANKRKKREPKHSTGVPDGSKDKA